MQGTVYTEGNEDWERIQAVEVLLMGVEIATPPNLCRHRHTIRHVAVNVAALLGLAQTRNATVNVAALLALVQTRSATVDVAGLLV